MAQNIRKYKVNRTLNTFDGLPARKYMVLLGHDRTLREPYSETGINFIMSEFSCCPSRPCAFIEIEHLSCVLLRMLSTNSLTGEYF